MSYFYDKGKHAYNCYLAGVPRKKVYAVVEKGDKFIVLKARSWDVYKYGLAGGGIEEGEDAKTAIIRECLEELNVEVEYVRTLGVIKDKSDWVFEGKQFSVDDEMEIVYTKFLKHGENKSFGIDGEFESQDVVREVTREEMLNNVAEFVKYGIVLDDDN